jgi:hypothetical protein
MNRSTFVILNCILIAFLLATPRTASSLPAKQESLSRRHLQPEVLTFFRKGWDVPPRNFSVQNVDPTPESNSPASGKIAGRDGLVIEYFIEGLAISSNESYYPKASVTGYPTGTQVTIHFKLYGPYSITGNWATDGTVRLNEEKIETVRAPDGNGGPGWSFSPKPVVVTITDEIRENGFAVSAYLGYARSESADLIWVKVTGLGGEAPDPEPPVEATEATNSACSPTFRGLDNLKPGDVISPGASYVDVGGKEVGIIQERWFINGQETSSASWNGQRTVVELQYTCLDHSAGTITLEIPAYQEPPAGQPPAGQAPGQEQAPSQPPAKQPAGSGLLTTVIGLGVAGIGALGLTSLGAFWIFKILKGGSVPKPGPGRPVRPPLARQPRPATGQTPPRTSQTSSGEKVGENETGEEKGRIDAVKEATEKYAGGLESAAEKLNELKEKVKEDKVLSPEAKKRITDYIESLTKPIEKVKERAESWGKTIGKYTDFRDQVTSITKELDKNLQEIAKTHQQAIEDMKNLPPGSAKAAADLATALDAFGRVADSALNKIPGYEYLGGDNTFEVSQSFREAGKGLQKAIETLKTSESEAMDLSKDGDALPGFTPKTIDPEIERVRREAEKYQWKSQSTWDWWKEKILGKTVDEKTKGFR